MVDGLDPADVNDGSGVLVFYNQPAGGSVQLVDGNYIAFVDFDGARGVTVPQTFTLEPADTDRVGSLALMVGSIANHQAPELTARPSTLRITVGGVVTEAQNLMVIVPDDGQVTAEVTLENKDIGFVNAGQVAEIKLETFPFTRYGTVNAVVTRVSADAVNDEKRGALFPVTLALKAAQIDVDGKNVRLTPGMNLTAEIRTGERRVAGSPDS